MRTEDEIKAELRQLEHLIKSKKFDHYTILRMTQKAETLKWVLHE